MSKGEKRMRRVLTDLGAKEKQGGEIEHTPESKDFAVGYVIIMIVLMAGIAVISQCSTR